MSPVGLWTTVWKPPVCILAVAILVSWSQKFGRKLPANWLAICTVYAYVIHIKCDINAHFG